MKFDNIIKYNEKKKNDRKNVKLITKERIKERIVVVVSLKENI